MLSATDYTGYQATCLELLAPDGRHLEFVGNRIKQELNEQEYFQLRDRVALVACLLGRVQDEVHLSLPAVLGLSEVFSRMRDNWKNR